MVKNKLATTDKLNTFKKSEFLGFVVSKQCFILICVFRSIIWNINNKTNFIKNRSIYNKNLIFI